MDVGGMGAASFKFGVLILVDGGVCAARGSLGVLICRMISRTSRASSEGVTDRLRPVMGTGVARIIQRAITRGIPHRVSPGAKGHER